jgi:hypothetical protein
MQVFANAGLLMQVFIAGSICSAMDKAGKDPPYSAAFVL